MTISGRQQNSSDDHTINDPYILPVHLYRAPPPSYDDITKPNQCSSGCSQELQGRDNAALVPDSDNNNNITQIPSEAPPAYESVPPSSS